MKFIRNSWFWVLMLWLILAFVFRWNGSDHGDAEKAVLMQGISIAKPRPSFIRGSTEKAASAGSARKPQQAKVSCDFSQFRTDICDLEGDIRVQGSISTVEVLQSDGPNLTHKIKPYTRKWEKSIMGTIGDVTVTTLDSRAKNCHVYHGVPAVIFSTGGYTGNVYHEFNDGLIPLYITSHQFKGRVVFMILELHQWWMNKYGPIIRALSDFPVINFDKSTQLHCFPRVILGLNIHGELTINSSHMAGGESIQSFQHLVRKAIGSSPEISAHKLAPRRPLLVLIRRHKTRVLLNEKEVIRLAKRMGFEVKTLEPHSRMHIGVIHDIMYSADVVIGVHGAALTHLLFMRPNSTLVQIIPLGTDWAASTYYGEPAIKAGLQYVGYHISPSESSLFQKFGPNHTVVSHPDKIVTQGWWEMKRVYLESQDVKLSLSRFKPFLHRVYSRIAILRKIY